MRFSVTHDVALSRDQVFARVSDFDGLTERANLRGAWIERQDPPGPISLGSNWKAEIQFHGLRRPASASITQLNPPERFVLSGQADGVDLHLELSLDALDACRTRMRLVADVKPRNVAGRLLVRTAKLMKSTLDARFKDRVRSFLRKIEAVPD